MAALSISNISLQASHYEGFPVNDNFLLKHESSSPLNVLSGNLSLVNNYRPISLLSNTSKVLERLVFDKIIGHIRNTISLSQLVL